MDFINDKAQLERLATLRRKKGKWHPLEQRAHDLLRAYDQYRGILSHMEMLQDRSQPLEPDSFLRTIGMKGDIEIAKDMMEDDFLQRAAELDVTDIRTAVHEKYIDDHQEKRLIKALDTANIVTLLRDQDYDITKDRDIDSSNVRDIDEPER